jgi:hypothetical protein
LTVTTSDTTLLDNDWDPEGDSLTASIVDSPSNGSISGFSGTAGTFTYTPDTSYAGERQRGQGKRRDKPAWNWE